MAEIKFYRDAEHTQQVYPAIDPDGNYPGVTVGLADNLSSSEGITDNDTWQYRSSGGELDISDGYANLRNIIGATSSSTIQEKLTYNLRTTGVTAVTVNASTFKSQISTSGTYDFIYTPVISYDSALVYSLNKTTFANYVNKTTGTYTFTYAANISREDTSSVIQSFNESTFISKVDEEPNSYIFTYNGSNWQLNGSNVTMSQYGITTKGTEVNGTSIVIYYNNNAWKINNNFISISSYGITTTGSEAIGDTIAISYSANQWQLSNEEITLADYGIAITTGTPAIDDDIQVVYIAEQVGAIVVSNPSALFSVGMNQFDIDGDQILTGYTIDSNGAITSGTGFYVIYFKVLGGEVYTIYNKTASSVGRVGYSEDAPTTSSSVTLLNTVSSSEWADTLINDTHKKHYVAENDGYMVVATSDIENLCCHLTWEAVNDDVYESYFDYALTIPYTDKNGNTISTYGLANVDNGAQYYDEIDLEDGKWYKRTTRIEYSAANLAEVQALNVPYLYDSNWIYYGIDTITYDLTEMSNAYQVSNYGTEEFLNSDLELTATIFYQDNLKDKLRFSCEVIDNKVTEINRDDNSVNYGNNMYPSVRATLALDNALRRILGIGVDTHSDEQTYAVGDYVIHDLKLWKCVRAVSSASVWDTQVSNWEVLNNVNVAGYNENKVRTYLFNLIPNDIRTANRMINLDRTGANTYHLSVWYLPYGYTDPETEGVVVYQSSNVSASDLNTMFGLTFTSDASGNKFFCQVYDNWIESYLFTAE